MIGKQFKNKWRAHKHREQIKPIKICKKHLNSKKLLFAQIVTENLEQPKLFCTLWKLLTWKHYFSFCKFWFQKNQFWVIITTGLVQYLFQKISWLFLEMMCSSLTLMWKKYIFFPDLYGFTYCFPWKKNNYSIISLSHNLYVLKS